MATLIAELTTAFTPAVGDFNVQVTGAAVRLERRQTDGAAWALVGGHRAQRVQGGQQPCCGC